MQGVLLLNGLPYTGELTREIEETNAYVVCCDGAYSWAKNRIKIDENVGDFDSLDEIPTPPPSQVYPSEKNQTDGELGLDILLEKGCEEIVIYGANGGRTDHFLGNLHLLFKAQTAGVTAKIITRNEVIFPLDKSGKFGVKEGATLSLFPFGTPVKIKGSKGLKYPLDDLSLEYGASRGISNIATAGEVEIELQSGVLLVVVNQEKQ